MHCTHAIRQSFSQSLRLVWASLQGFVYIKNDKEMVDPETGTASIARNTNLNEDLGKIEYVFSDKTGTLTANEMQLREIAIKGVAYGNASFRYHIFILRQRLQQSFSEQTSQHR